MATENVGIWARRPPADRRRNALSRETITAAALAVADAEGVDAVTIRRVAGELSARPMSLYSHIERKDDLIDLMLDEIVGGALLDAVPADWRTALTAIARATRSLALAHPWVVDAIPRRSFMGPHGVAHLEQSLAAVAELDVAPARKRAILRAVDAYTIGTVTVELIEVNARRRLDVSPADWRRSALAYISELAATGDYPQLATTAADDLLGDDDPDDAFEAGLGWLLDGIAASV